VKAAAERYQPDQVILFGSAARGEMTEHSDIDLLVIKLDHPTTSRIQHDTLRINGDQLDILTMNPRHAEAHRRTAATVQERALAEGITVHLPGPGREPVPVGQSWFTDEDGMVRTTKLKPDKSKQFLDRAETRWRTSNVEENDEELRCYLRHQCLEQALKGIVTAQGRNFQHTHKLHELWTDAETDGETIRAARDDKLLARLTRYATTGRYDAPKVDEDKRTLAESQNLVEDVLNHAREAIPRLTRETNAILANTPHLAKPSAEFLAGQPVDHSNDNLAKRPDPAPTTVAPQSKTLKRT
jgi:predicted nucleotidyltransferase/HEPN domain-containing protein